jgi:assimilatory nitrate reductase catalytic subunit
VRNEGWTRTTCPYCGVGCGVLARVQDDGSAEIKGDPEHPANFGRLCSKGSALGETLSLDGRLLKPIVDGAETSWDEALDRVATRFAQTIAEHGPDSVALYVSGQLLIEDYYVANKLMKGFVGSANIDTNSRLCMASSVAGHRRAFGSDTVPGCYEDLEEADLVVLVGSNLAWCHPVLFQRLTAAREKRGTRIVAIDPRATVTTEVADLHLAIAPGADVALFAGLVAHLAEVGRVDRAYVEAHTVGFEAALAEARAFDLAAAARTTELSLDALKAFYDLFARTERVVTVYSQGVNQSSAGTDKVNAILNCHLATGRIGRPGMGPFSVTGQPNAMGGREVGGLANMLAAHMEIENPGHCRIVQDFWGSPLIATKAGLKAVDLFRAVEDGRVKALWIIGTNPADSMPEADRVREAIRNCPFVVVSDVCSRTDTTALADVLLPAAAWGEKDGTVTNSERRMSRQRAFLSLPGEALPDWRQVAEVAKRMGFGDAFAWRSPAEIFGEYARLTATENDGLRDLDLGAFADLSDDDYAALAPFQWPRRVGKAQSETRFFADGRFYNADGKARFVATPFRAPIARTSVRFPFVLNTGRIRDQWHTMTRTAKTPRLMAHIGEPFVEIHPDDARTIGVAAADLAEIESEHGRAILRVVVTERQRRGSLFAPMHWTDQYAALARVDALVSSAVDPVSGQPEVKFTAVAAKRYAAHWHAFAASRAPIATGGADYFAIASARGGWKAELAGLAAPEDWTAFARATLGLGGEAETIAYHDAAGQRRFVAFANETFAGAIFIARGPVTAARSWITERLGQPIASEDRLKLLAGRPGAEARDRGPTVCACFDVGRNEIVEPAAEGCSTVAAIGARLRAGTNCGSCRGEIARLVGAESRAPQRTGPLLKAL